MPTKFRNTKCKYIYKNTQLRFFCVLEKKYDVVVLKWGAATPQPVHPHISTSSHSLTFTLMGGFCSGMIVV